jgi:hypothetical protein
MIGLLNAPVVVQQGFVMTQLLGRGICDDDGIAPDARAVFETDATGQAQLFSEI